MITVVVHSPSHVQLFVTPHALQHTRPSSLSPSPRVCPIHVHWLVGLVAKPCPTLATPWTLACQAPLSMGFSRQEYWSRFAISFSRGSFWPSDQTQVSCIAGRFFTNWTMREAPIMISTVKLTYQSPYIVIIFCVYVENSRQRCLVGYSPWGGKELDVLSD